MAECVDCFDPPGGRVCCHNGQTPMCLIKDGKVHSVCLEISRAAAASPPQFARAVADAIVRVVGEGYRDDVLANFSFAGGILSYQSFDHRIMVTARQVLSDSNSGAIMA